MGRKSCLIKSLRSVPVPWHKLSLHHAIQRSDVPINISGHFSFKRRTSYSPLLVPPRPPSFYFSSLLFIISLFFLFLLTLFIIYPLFSSSSLQCYISPAPTEEPQPGRPFKVTPENGPSSTPVTERLSLGRRDDRHGMLMQP